MKKRILWLTVDIMAAAFVLVIVWVADYKIPQKGVKAVSIENAVSEAEKSQNEMPDFNQKIQMGDTKEGTASLQKTCIVRDSQDWHKKYVDKLIKGTTNKGLFITGAYGVGKTYLASCIANEIIKNGKSVIFGTLIQLLDFIRDSYSDSEVSDKDYLNLYSSVDLLVIDDLGKEKPTEWVLEKLFLIVNNRYNNYLPIVITTNYNRNQLRERLCINKNYSMVDSIISRLYEMCGGIEIKDDDYRMSDSPIRESLRNS